MKKLASLLLALATAAGSASAQDIHFSQFFESAALRNPALTGIYTGDYYVSANYRNQWGSFVVPFQTSVLNAESKVLLHESTKDYLSFGLTASYDKAGSLDFTSISAYGAVNYNKSLGEESNTYLSVGLCGGYIQRSFDITKIRTASQYINGSYNASNATGESMNFGTVRHYDVGAGVSLSGALTRRINYYAGIAGYHLASPQETYFDESLIRLTTKWSGNFGISARLGNGFGLIAHFNYQHQQPYQEIIGGAMISHAFHSSLTSKKILLAVGAFYRFEDAAIPMMQMQYDNWTLTCSYDMTLASKRLYLTGFGGYEFSLSIRGNYAHKETSLQCPRFEHDLDFEDEIMTR